MRMTYDCSVPLQSYVTLLKKSLCDDVCSRRDALQTFLKEKLSVCRATVLITFNCDWLGPLRSYDSSDVTAEGVFINDHTCSCIFTYTQPFCCTCMNQNSRCARGCPRGRWHRRRTRLHLAFIIHISTEGAKYESEGAV